MSPHLMRSGRSGPPRQAPARAGAPRPDRLTRHLVLAARTAWGLATEDPALFAVQAVRRLPAPVSRTLARGLRAVGPDGSTPRIVGCWLAGWRDEARAAIATRATRGRLGRLVGEVAVELDALDPSSQLPAPTAARAAWRRGDLAAAVATAPAGSALRRRLDDELRLLTGAPDTGPVPTCTEDSRNRIDGLQDTGKPPPRHAPKAPTIPVSTMSTPKTAVAAPTASPVPPEPGGLSRATHTEDSSHRPHCLPKTARTVPPVSPAVAAEAGKDRLRCLHLLVNSVPTTTSGYALRSHAVLRAQRAAGIDAVAATRLGYPVNVGLVTGRDLDVVDQVPYHRLVGWSAPRLPSQRIDAHVAAATTLAGRHGVRSGAGVVHATTPFINGLVAQRVAARLGVPWVYEVRGLLEDTWAASFPTPDARRAASASQRHALARAREADLAAAADHVVVLGATVRDSLVARGVSAAQISVVPNAVDDALLTCDNDPATARARLGLEPGGFWVGTVGSLVDYEGVGTLLAAVARLRAQGADVRVAVVGDGVARPALVRQVAALGLGSAAVLPGRVGADQVVAWYQALDVFAVPRRDTAVTRTVVPLKPMQAMALRRPVVASDLPALREVIGDPGAGLMVRPDDPETLADALAALADDPDLVARLGTAGRRFAATRTWSAVGQTYRALYERLGVATPGERLAA